MAKLAKVLFWLTVVLLVLGLAFGLYVKYAGASHLQGAARMIWLAAAFSAIASVAANAMKK